MRLFCHLINNIFKNNCHDAKNIAFSMVALLGMVFVKFSMFAEPFYYHMDKHIRLICLHKNATNY